jgi:spore coat polysaccharide biosynthesis protein SpsF (cytidylyltransferase family)
MRAPKKPFAFVNGRPLIDRLITRLQTTGLPVILAVPAAELNDWANFCACKNYSENGKFFLFSGYDDCPLSRTNAAAEKFRLNTIIRVTHDKVLVDTSLIFKAIGVCRANLFSYGYSSGMIDGTGFEIISAKALSRAVEANNGRAVEHISYAIRSVCADHEKADLSAFGIANCDGNSPRLLVDYPEDIAFLNILFATLGDPSISDVKKWCSENFDIADLNKLPDVTIYTCAYNAEKWIHTAMKSALGQDVDFEYIVVDDFSTDATPMKIGQLAALFRDKVKYVRNPKNLGLAASSNVALGLARGKYIVRLDADDFFSTSNSVSELLQTISARKLEALYPGNYFGDFSKVQMGEEQHHVGGAIFKTSALNHIRFTDGLRAYEGYDLFLRAREVLRVGYLAKPTFFYRQHGGSLSKNNVAEREQIKKQIEVSHEAKMANR